MASIPTAQLLPLITRAQRLIADNQSGPARAILLDLIGDLTGKRPATRWNQSGVDWNKVLGDPANLIPASVLARKLGVRANTVYKAALRRGITLPVIQVHSRAPKGIAWAEIWADPANLAMNQNALAVKLGVNVMTVKHAAKRYGITLPKGVGGWKASQKPRKKKAPAPKPVRLVVVREKPKPAPKPKAQPKAPAAEPVFVHPSIMEVAELRRRAVPRYDEAA